MISEQVVEGVLAGYLVSETRRSVCVLFLFHRCFMFAKYTASLSLSLSVLYQLVFRGASLLPSAGLSLASSTPALHDDIDFCDNTPAGQAMHVLYVQVFV